MKKIFIVGAFSGKNVGDNAILECILKDIKILNPDVTFIIPTKDIKYINRYSDQYSIQTIPINLKNLFLKFIPISIQSLKSIRDSDLIVITASLFYDWKLFNFR